MTSPQPPVNQNIETKPNDKELNFRALEQKYQKQLEQERSARLDAERKAQEALTRTPSIDEDDDSEPYVDIKKLKKEQAKFGQQLQNETKQEVRKAVQEAIYEERKNTWLKNNSDFYDVMQHAEKFAQHDPELAETILEMPEGFERQKLVYKNIKALGIHKPRTEEPTIQQKIDSNRRAPYYQPTGIGTMPYSAQVGDFSKAGQKQAYEKLKDLKAKLRV